MTNQFREMFFWTSHIVAASYRLVHPCTEMESAKAAIPRGYRRKYILLQNIDTARCQKWAETVENIDFKKSSRKELLLRKFEDTNTPKQRDAKIVIMLHLSSRPPEIAVTQLK